MSADVTTTLATWSTTESSNLPIGTTAISTNLDDNLRMIQAVVRSLASTDTIASATTCDIGTKTALYIDVTGTTTITGLGTISSGIWKLVKFSGILTLTHNATSLILPSAANITTAAGDTAMFMSLGSGNWRCLFYTPATGYPVNPALNMADGSAAAPSLFFAADTNTGLYRIGSDSIGIAAGGVKVGEFSAANGLVVPKAVKLGTAATQEIQIDSSGSIILTPQAGQSFSVAGSSTTGGGVILTSGIGQSMYLTSGDTTGASTGGSMRIAAGGTATGTPGDIYLTPGVSSTNQVGGNVYIDLNGTTTAANIQVSTNAIYWYKLNGKGKHITVLDSGNRPTILSGGGTSPGITGSDNAFQITVGSGGSATTITVTFNKAWVNAPMVMAQHHGASLPLYCSASTTTVQIDATTAFTAGGKIDVFCIGRE